LIEIPRTIGLKKDDSNSEVGTLQNYLKRFGYIIPDQVEQFGAVIDRRKAIAAPEKDVFDQNTEEALKRFQAFNKLPVTGVLDKQTLNLMSRPRCGVPDFIISRKRSSVGEVEEFVASGSKWDTINLTYRMENFTPDLTQDIVRRAIQEGLNQWASVTPLRFSEVTSGGEIKISFASGDHGDGWPFDGPSGTLAHAFYPTDGRLHFDEVETWTDNDPPSGIDLATVAVHELGHILGLDHSSETQAVMYAYYGGRRRALHSDDISGIQSIYGVAQWRYNQKVIGLWVTSQSTNAWVYIQNLGWKKIGGTSDEVTNSLMDFVTAKETNTIINFYEQNGVITESYFW
jgi:predicted Zn-dependent protease